MQDHIIEGNLKTDRYLVNFNTEDLPGDFFDVVIIGSGIAGVYTA